jgi:hypothetical protein
MSYLDPLCRFCGSPIPKKACTVWIEPKSTKNLPPVSAFFRSIYVDAPAAICTKELAQRLTHLTIVSVRYSKPLDGTAPRIICFTEWDGVSYRDKYFCTDACAIQLGYAYAATGGHSKAYTAAMGDAA